MNVHGRWADASRDNAVVGWARALFTAAAPFATGSVYVNFLTGDEEARVRAAYGSNYDRLVALKNRYDPTNLFRVNQNIQPTAFTLSTAGVPEAPTEPVDIGTDPVAPASLLSPCGATVRIHAGRAQRGSGRRNESDDEQHCRHDPIDERIGRRLLKEKRGDAAARHQRHGRSRA